VANTFPEISDSDFVDKESSLGLGVVVTTKKFRQQSQKDRKAFNKQKSVDQLSRTRSGRVLAKPLTNKQRNHLQSISKDTISEYLKNRK